MMELPFDQYYFLGDSISDTGNVFNLSGGNFPNAPFYAPGRFSDGKIWVDYFAEELGLNIVPFTNPNVSSPIDGINFAIGGASSADSNIGLSSPTDPNGPGLKEQVDALTGLLKKQPPNSVNDDLFVLCSGANDYLAMLNDLPDTAKETKKAVQEVVDKNLSKQLKRVINSGAKHIAVLNLPNLGATPLGLSLGPNVVRC